MNKELEIGVLKSAFVENFLLLKESTMACIAKLVFWFERKRPEEAEKSREVIADVGDRLSKVDAKLKEKVKPNVRTGMFVAFLAIVTWFLLPAIILFCVLFVGYVLIGQVLKSKGKPLSPSVVRVILPSILAVALLYGILGALFGSDDYEYSSGQELEVVVHEEDAPSYSDIIEVRPEALQNGGVYRIGYYQVTEVDGRRLIADICPGAYIRKKEIESAVCNSFGQALFDAAENSSFPSIVLYSNRDLVVNDKIPQLYAKYVGTESGMRAYREVKVEFRKKPEVLDDGIEVDLGKDLPFLEVFGVGLGRPPKKVEVFEVKSKTDRSDGKRECVFKTPVGPFESVCLDYTEFRPPAKVLRAFEFSKAEVNHESLSTDTIRETVSGLVAEAEKRYKVKMECTSNEDMNLAYRWLSDDHKLIVGIGWIVSGGVGHYYYKVQHRGMEMACAKQRTDMKWTPVTGESLTLGGKVQTFLGIPLGAVPAEVEKTLGNPLGDGITGSDWFETYILKKPFRFFEEVRTYYTTDLHDCRFLEKLIFSRAFYADSIKAEDLEREMSALAQMIGKKFGLEFRRKEGSADLCYEDEYVNITISGQSDLVTEYNDPSDEKRPEKYRVYRIALTLDCSKGIVTAYQAKNAKAAAERKAKIKSVSIDPDAGMSEL